jgi:hypothetical protein
VTFEPLGAIQARAFAVELERRLVPGWSLALQPVLVFASQAVTRPDGTVGREDALVWGASLHLRAFVAGDGLTGLFAGPVLTASTGGFRAADGNGASGPDGVTASTPVAIAAGALLGYNHLLGRPFLLSLGLGAQYHLRLDGDRTLRDGRFLPLLRLAIGAAF